MNKLTKDNQTFIAMIFTLVLIKVIDMTLIHSQQNQGAPASMTWIAIVTTTVCGFVSVKLSDRSGFPALWDDDLDNRRRFLYPAAIGFVLGITRHIFETLNHGSGSIQFPLSVSLPFYLFTAITGEILFHIFPLVLIVWLLSTVILKQRHGRYIFTIAAVLLSAAAAWNALSAWQPAALPFGSTLSYDLSLAGLYFLVELLLYFIFRHRGYLSAISARLAYFLAWHIISPAIFLQ